MLLRFLTHKTMVYLLEVSWKVDSEMEIYVHKVSWEYPGSIPVAEGRGSKRSSSRQEEKSKYSAVAAKASASSKNSSELGHSGWTSLLSYQVAIG